MQVSEIMHHGVVTANIKDSIKTVAALMKEEDIGGIPILDEGRPVGFVTDRDIVLSCVAEGASAAESITNAMTEEIFFISQEKDVKDAVLVMQKNQICRLLVVDQNEKPVGMLSLHDLVEKDDVNLTATTLEKIKQH